ncbi:MULTISPECIES: TolC family protein [Azospira]|uniref:Outer membrane protein n=1 Tax=Azospira oryzae (strain ATCC BAA-33 / DSM 13638 / PS) TaxID=640081 RepID=G8QKS5_AZOOP|nr:MULTISPECIES: TolC family protein [Azospira]AEV25530.1 outer membrane protein [Azospira oryzae PS]
MNLRCLLVLAVAGTCGIPLSGYAAESLRLEEAVSRALASHPSLAAEAAQLKAVQARAQREGLATPFMIGADVENVGGTGAFRGGQSAETTLRIGRVIELGGKREARQALGSAEINQQQNLSEATRLDVISRTSLRFISVLADQQRLKYAQEQVGQAERTRREVANWVAAARNPESDLRAAEIAVADAELERTRAEHKLTSARLTLASSWGVLTPDFETAAGNLLVLPKAESLDTLVARLPMTPEQRAALLEADSIAARKRLAEAGAKPDVTVNLGVRRLEATSDQALMMSVSIPLGNQVRSGLSVAEANAQLMALEARRDAQRFEHYQSLFGKYQELNQARTEAETLQKHMLPKAEEALAFTRRGFEAGRFSFLALAQAQKTLFELRQRAVDAAARCQILMTEVERLTAIAPEPTP